MTAQINDLLFFDNLALHYVVNETPPAIFARVFLRSDSRLSGSMLGVMTGEQRKTVHELMAREDDGDKEKDTGAENALLIGVDDVLKRGHIERRGRHFYGVERTQ